MKFLPVRRIINTPKNVFINIPSLNQNAYNQKPTTEKIIIDF